MKRIFFCLFSIAVLFSTQAYSQDTLVDSTSAQRQTIDDLFSEPPPENVAQRPGMPSMPGGLSINEMDEETREKYFEALRGHFEYRLNGYEHRQRVFEWQLFSAKIIFVIVIFLVTAGIYFSWVQFRSFLKMKESGAETQSEITELQASAEGIKISSPVLGVIILVISLLFFYLYLVYVYPIEEIF